MQVEVFTLCDSAQVYSGKAIIVGAFNQIIAPKLPIVMQSVTLAIRISFEAEESSDKSFHVGFFKPDGSVLIPELRFEAKQLSRSGMQEPLTTFDTNIMLGRLAFDRYGRYNIKLSVDKHELEFHFYVKSQTQ